jgi:hypothetical protein
LLHGPPQRFTFSPIIKLFHKFGSFCYTLYFYPSSHVTVRPQKAVSHHDVLYAPNVPHSIEHTTTIFQTFQVCKFCSTVEFLFFSQNQSRARFQNQRQVKQQQYRTIYSRILSQGTTRPTPQDHPSDQGARASALGTQVPQGRDRIAAQRDCQRFPTIRSTNAGRNGCGRVGLSAAHEQHCTLLPNAVGPV